MFTIKCYTASGRCIIRSAESFTILRDDETGEAQITLHQPDETKSSRVDIVHPRPRDYPDDRPRDIEWPPAFQWAYVENVAGKTVEHITLKPPRPHPAKARAVEAA